MSEKANLFAFFRTEVLSTQSEVRLSEDNTKQKNTFFLAAPNMFFSNRNSLFESVALRISKIIQKLIRLIRLISGFKYIRLIRSICVRK